MGGQSNMGGSVTPTQATQGMGGGFDLSKLFMGNAPAAGGAPASPLPQIQAPARPPMPTMPQRTPMPMPQAPMQPNPMDPLTAFRKYAQEVQSMSGHERHLNRRSQGGGR